MKPFGIYKSVFTVVVVEKKWISFIWAILVKSVSNISNGTRIRFKNFISFLRCQCISVQELRIENNCLVLTSAFNLKFVIHPHLILSTAHYFRLIPSYEKIRLERNGIRILSFTSFSFEECWDDWNGRHKNGCQKKKLCHFEFNNYYKIFIIKSVKYFNKYLRKIKWAISLLRFT